MTITISEHKSLDPFSILADATEVQATAIAAALTLSITITNTAEDETAVQIHLNTEVAQANCTIIDAKETLTILCIKIPYTNTITELCKMINQCIDIINKMLELIEEFDFIAVAAIDNEDIETANVGAYWIIVMYEVAVEAIDVAETASCAALKNSVKPECVSTDLQTEAILEYEAVCSAKTQIADAIEILLGLGVVCGTAYNSALLTNTAINAFPLVAVPITEYIQKAANLLIIASRTATAVENCAKLLQIVILIQNNQSALSLARVGTDAGNIVNTATAACIDIGNTITASMDTNTKNAIYTGTLVSLPNGATISATTTNMEACITIITYAVYIQTTNSKYLKLLHGFYNFVTIANPPTDVIIDSAISAANLATIITNDAATVVCTDANTANLIWLCHVSADAVKTSTVAINSARSACETNNLAKVNDLVLSSVTAISAAADAYKVVVIALKTVTGIDYDIVCARVETLNCLIKSNIPNVVAAAAVVSVYLGSVVTDAETVLALVMANPTKDPQEILSAASIAVCAVANVVTCGKSVNAAINLALHFEMGTMANRAAFIALPVVNSALATVNAAINACKSVIDADPGIIIPEQPNSFISGLIGLFGRYF